MPVALLTAAWIAGLLLGFQWAPPPLAALLLALAALPLALLLRLARRSVWPAVLAVALLLGLWRVAAVEPPPVLVAQDGRQVAIQGRIHNDPEATAQWVRFHLEVAALDRGDGWREQPGRVLTYAQPPPALVGAREPPFFRHGDVLTLRGTLQRPEPIEDFDYPAFLASQGVSAVFWSRQVDWHPTGHGGNWRTRVFDLRRALSRGVEQALPLPQSSLAQALLLGLRARLPADVVEDFRSSGTSHLLAISGLHVGVLLVMALGAGTWLVGKHRQIYLLLPLAAIWTYALVSGLPVSVTRAAIMGSMFLLALAVGRPRSALAALALSAFLITAWDPRAITQVSFQLSFAAMAGIILALPYQARVAEAIRGAIAPASPWSRVWFQGLLAWTAAALIVSLAATLATLPLVAFNFQRIPIFGIPATILAMPAMPFILLGSLAAAAGGLVHPLLGQLLGWVAWAPLSYLLALVAAAPGVTVSGSWMGAPLVWAWYAALGALLVLPTVNGRFRSWWHRLAGPAPPRTRRGASPRPDGLALGIGGAALLLAISGGFLLVHALGSPDGKLHVHFFDVGQGDSILIVTPNGRQVLVDGGPQATSATAALPGPLSPWDRSLDLVAVTHLDADHSRGLLEVMERYRVGAVLEGWSDPTAALYPQWEAAIQRRGLQNIQVFSGYRILLDEDVVIEVLHPPPPAPGGPVWDRNNAGLVLRVLYGETSFLLTGDIEAPAERYLSLAHEDLNSWVMQAPHHGSRTSTTAGFLERVGPRAAVISAGEDSPYGHPHQEVLERLEQAVDAGNIFVTAEHGHIQFISDGRAVWVKTER